MIPDNADFRYLMYGIIPSFLVTPILKLYYPSSQFYPALCKQSIYEPKRSEISSCFFDAYKMLPYVPSDCRTPLAPANVWRIFNYRQTEWQQRAVPSLPLTLSEHTFFFDAYMIISDCLMYYAIVGRYSFPRVFEEFLSNNRLTEWQTAVSTVSKHIRVEREL